MPEPADLLLEGIRIFPDRASTTASSVDTLLLVLVLVTGAVALTVFALIVIFAIRYRRRPGHQRSSGASSNLRLEIGWTVATAVVGVGLFFFGARVYFREKNPPEDATRIWVVAKQWMWKVQHPGGRREINEVHVPVGRKVRLTLVSQDVIHSFYVPAFRLKQDVLPGRYEDLWFEATKPGDYRLFCAEYCGTGHSQMIGWVHAVDPAEYDAWLAGGVPGESMVEAGNRIFVEQGCQNCHMGSAEEKRCPNLAGLYATDVQLENGETVKADLGYLRDAILNPRQQIVKGYPPIMPTYQGILGEDDLAKVIEYLTSLGPASGDGPDAPKATGDDGEEEGR